MIRNMKILFKAAMGERPENSVIKYIQKQGSRGI